MAEVSALVSFSGTRRPVFSCLMTSTMPPTSDAMTGLRCLSASMRTTPSPSVSPRSSNMAGWT